MLELFIESILSLLEAPLTGIGISPVAVLRGVELFVIVLLTVFGSYFVRRFVRTLKLRFALSAWHFAARFSVTKTGAPYRPALCLSRKCHSLMIKSVGIKRRKSE